MKRKPSLIPGLDRILSAREAFVLLSIPQNDLLKFYNYRCFAALNILLNILSISANLLVANPTLSKGK